MNELAYLLKETQQGLKNQLYYILRGQGLNPVYGDGYLYAKGEIPVMLVAHMDTVAPYPPQRIMYKKKEDKIYNPNGILGGDDRCGIYAIIQLLDKFKPYVLFTEDEEIGCIGARKAAKYLDIPKVKYIIEIDRRGKDDCVFYSCGNNEFIKYVEEFEFKKNYGTCSDISILGKAWDIASVNLSSGYYNEHTEDEYIIFGELQNTIRRIENMLNAIEKAPYFDYQERKYNYLMDDSSLGKFLRINYPDIYYSEEYADEYGRFDEKKFFSEEEYGYDDTCEDGISRSFKQDNNKNDKSGGK